MQGKFVTIFFFPFNRNKQKVKFSRQMNVTPININNNRNDYGCKQNQQTTYE